MSPTTPDPKKMNRILALIGTIILSVLALKISGIDSLVDKVIIVDKHAEQHDYHYPVATSKDSSDPVTAVNTEKKTSSDPNFENTELKRISPGLIGCAGPAIKPKSDHEDSLYEASGIYDLEKFKKDSLSEKKKKKFKRETQKN